MPKAYPPVAKQSPAPSDFRQQPSDFSASKYIGLALLGKGKAASVETADSFPVRKKAIILKESLFSNHRMNHV